MSQSAYCGTHQWVITDKKLLVRMLTAKNGQTFTSDRLNIAGLPCRIEVCPNGWKPETKGFFMVYTTIKPLPSAWKFATIRVKIAVPQFETQSTVVELFGRVKSIPWRTGTLRLQDVIKSNPNKITLIISIAALKVINTHHHPIYFNSCYNYTKSTIITTSFDAETVKRLSTSYQCRSIETDIAGNMWLLRIYPNGETINPADKGKFMICPQLLCLPFNICQMEVTVTSHCKQTNTKRTITCTYAEDNMWSYRLDLDQLSFESLQYFDELTITTNIDILYVYDQHGTEMAPPYNIIEPQPAIIEQKDNDYNENILQTTEIGKLNNEIKTLNTAYNVIKNTLSTLTDSFQNNKSIINQTQQKFITESARLDSITNRIQQMNNKLLAKQNETININHSITTIKRQLNTLSKKRVRSNDDEKENADKIRVRQWLCGVVKLPQYYEVLIAEGFEDLESIADVTTQNLKQMGIEKIGHQNKLIKYATQLNVQKPAYSHNYSGWKCRNCNTANPRSLYQCKLCGRSKWKEK